MIFQADESKIGIAQEQGSPITGDYDMINFEEELENFKPSLEMNQVEDAICDSDVADVTDIIRDLMKEMKK